MQGIVCDLDKAERNGAFAVPRLSEPSAALHWCSVPRLIVTPARFKPFN
jgi:hypothetical protein